MNAEPPQPSDESSKRAAQRAGARQFRTTRWSLVRRASSAGSGGRRALEELCTQYWYPLYADLRRRGRSPDDAQDLTQGFFADLLSRGDLAQVDPQLGRFRSFLSSALRNFVSKSDAARRTLKRGGGRAPLPFDFEQAEERLRREPEDTRTPETAFAARWARALLDGVFEELRQLYAARGELELFEALSAGLGGEGLPYAALAKELDRSEGALKTAASRLKARFGATLRTRVAETLDDPGDVDDELRSLFGALSESPR